MQLQCDKGTRPPGSIVFSRNLTGESARSGDASRGRRLGSSEKATKGFVELLARPLPRPLLHECTRPARHLTGSFSIIEKTRERRGHGVRARRSQHCQIARGAQYGGDVFSFELEHGKTAGHHFLRHEREVRQ